VSFRVAGFGCLASRGGGKFACLFAPSGFGDESQALLVVCGGFYNISKILHVNANFSRLWWLPALAAWLQGVVADVLPCGVPSRSGDETVPW